MFESKNQSFKIFFSKNSVRMFFFGFSSGLPILLVFSTLSVWLVKAGVSRSTITMFSWAALAYSFKFIWSPVIDNLKIPIKDFGHRKSWLLISQLMIIFSLIFISFTDPSKTLILTAIGSVLIAFSSASQDIIIDAYRMLMGDVDQEEYDKASPILQIKEDFPPTMLVHGSSDSVVRLQDSTDLYQKLKEENIPAELHIFSEEDHAFDSARGYGRSVAELQHLFFKKYL